VKYEERFRAMNTEIVMAAEGEESDVRAGFAAVRQFIEASEKRFSRFLETSELSLLNRSAGEPFGASAELYEIVETALGYVDATVGLFDPAILGALRQAGYDRSLDELQETGAPPAEPTLAGPAPDIHGVQLEPQERQIWMPPGTSLDLGGIAKGWIAGGPGIF
jgi:thiamine biosynthesis lipoprotein